MANDVINEVTLRCESLRANQIMSELKFDDSCLLDFNKVVPMPESLNIEAGSGTDDAISACLVAMNPDMPVYYPIDKVKKEELSALFVKLNSSMPMMSNRYRCTMSDDEMKNIFEKSEKFYKRDKCSTLLLGKKAIDNFVKYGAITWYEWRINNWGTKWNAYDFWTGKEDGFIFSTAWATPEPIIAEISKKYPDVEVHVKYSDEDIGSNCGTYTYKNDVEIDHWYPENGRQAVEFGLKLWGMEDPKEYGLVLNEDGTDYVNL